VLATEVAHSLGHSQQQLPRSAGCYCNRQNVRTDARVQGMSLAASLLYLQVRSKAVPPTKQSGTTVCEKQRYAHNTAEGH
jgi:hypothetical protein